MKGEQEFTYHGDRTRDEIVKFALRVSGPPVQEITKTQSFDTIKKERDLYFLYIGEKFGPLWVWIFYFTYNILIDILINSNIVFRNIITRLQMCFNHMHFSTNLIQTLLKNMLPGEVFQHYLFIKKIHIIISLVKFMEKQNIRVLMYLNT